MDDGASLDERDDRMIDAYRDGCTVAEIAQAFGLTRQRVYQVFSARGVELERRLPHRPPPRALPMEDRRLMLQLRAEGESVLGIMEELGYSRADVRRVLEGATQEEIHDALTRSEGSVNHH